MKGGYGGYRVKTQDHNSKLGGSLMVFIIVILLVFVSLLFWSVNKDESATEQANNPPASQTVKYEEFTTKSGIRCIALGHYGFSGRGLSCDWGNSK